MTKIQTMKYKVHFQKKWNLTNKKIVSEIRSLTQPICEVIFSLNKLLLKSNSAT